MVFDSAFYSAPCRLLGQTLRVRGGSQQVRIYTSDYTLVATHPRAERPGERLTHPDHLPPTKAPGVLWTRATCRALAAEVGPATAELVGTLLDDPVVDRHARAIRILRLRSQVGECRLEDASARVLAFGDLRYANPQAGAGSGPGDRRPGARAHPDADASPDLCALRRRALRSPLPQPLYPCHRPGR